MSRARAPYRRFLWGETRLLMDYLKATYPGKRWHTEMRVGATEGFEGKRALTPDERKIFRAWNGRADGIVVLENEIIAIEPGIRRILEKVGCLLAVMNDIPETEDLGAARLLPLRGELVSPYRHRRAERVCEQVGIRYVYFPVPWLDQALMEQERQFRKQSLSGVRQTFVE